MEIESYQRKIAILVGQNQGGKLLEKLPKLDTDLQAVRAGLASIGFNRDDIFEIKNRSNEELANDLGLDQLELI